MTRSIARWIAVAAICVTILCIPVWTGALKAAEESYSPDFFGPGGGGGRLGWGPPRVEQSHDKDCIGDFKSQAQAQRFLLEHGRKSDRHHLDGDRDGIACEEFDY